MTIENAPPPRVDLRLSTNALTAILSLAAIACCVAMSMPQVHIVAYCGDLGYGVARGAEMLSLMLGFGIISRIGSGFLADKIGGIRTLLIGSVAQGTALLFYLFFDGLTSLYIISAMFGLFQGGIVPSYAIIVREAMPASEAATRVGIVIFASVFGMSFGGWISGAIFDATGSYGAAFANGLAWNALNIADHAAAVDARAAAAGDGVRQSQVVLLRTSNELLSSRGYINTSEPALRYIVVLVAADISIVAQKLQQVLPGDGHRCLRPDFGQIHAFDLHGIGPGAGPSEQRKSLRLVRNGAGDDGVSCRPAAKRLHASDPAIFQLDRDGRAEIRRHAWVVDHRSRVLERHDERHSIAKWRPQPDQETAVGRGCQRLNIHFVGA